MMNRITLVLGGTRSGKSAYAEKLALAQLLPVTYFATADCRDAEMAKRIELHKTRRPATWATWEGKPEELPSAVSGTKGLMLLDCLTMWLTRLFLADPASENGGEREWHEAEDRIAGLTERLCESVTPGASLIIVSSEVGFGLVPPYLMGRRFRDMQGRMNQICARHADGAALVVAGCPLWIKGSANLEGEKI